MSAKNIDEVIQQLGDIIEDARREKSRLGYFAALYRRVTIAVKEGICEGRFENGPRMEHLDVIFANRYLKAYERFKKGGYPSTCWTLSFECAGTWRLLALQHLLLGMNAHINLDLGIAAVQTSNGSDLMSLKRDFDEINNVLAELVDGTQDRIAEISPMLGFIDHIGNRSDEALVNFSMNKARDAAWDFAEKLSTLSEEAQVTEIQRQDDRMRFIGRLVHTPGITGTTLALGIRLFESNNIRKVIDVLSK